MFRGIYVIVIAFLLTAPVAAADVGDAKAKGHACEQTNGYLRATGSAPGDVKALVKNVNAKRKEQYAKIATKNGVAVDQVAKLTAQKLINAAPQHACK
ncbi:MAG: YdbL family protein [Arenicellales bacterium]|nr:YdbL family protein [Arenicellales bacterium]